MKFEIFLISILLLSCHSNKNNETEKIKLIVREWQNKTIKIPPGSIEYKVTGRDTICPDIWSKPYKILTYVDSIGCTGCQLGLPQWKQFIDLSVIEQLDIGFIFIVHSVDYEIFELMLQESDFHYPIIYDRNNDFDKLNHFSKSAYRTFLIDKDNKVLLLGSPVYNPELIKLYKKTINANQQ
ncbi:MAG: hypothetical protein LBK58_08465 [Prevotellaceae bacterium]|jgi:hypothetical protein|nr:hypothetical protein [Prevotellaceae bacterium]